MIKCFCDKCGKEIDRGMVQRVKVIMGFAEASKEWCTECCEELVPKSTERYEYYVANKTIGERFEEVVREIVGEVVEGK